MLNLDLSVIYKPFNPYIPCKTLQEWNLSKIYKSRLKNKKNQNHENQKLELKINLYRQNFLEEKILARFKNINQKHKTKEYKIMT